MKNVKKCWFLVIGLLITANLFGQHGKENFSNCAAAFLNQNMIVNEYTTTGKCVVNAAAKGTLTVRPAEMMESDSVKTGEKISFKIAIRDGNSKTLMSFSDKIYQEIPLQEILTHCKRGDYIVLLTLEREWALPHSEILVSAGQ